MTVVIGFVAEDGAVMASDSQATESDATRHDTPKIWTCGELVLGYSGYSAVRQPLTLAYEEALDGTPNPSRWEARALLCQAGRPVLESAYKNFVPMKAGEHAGRLAGLTLVIGHDTDGYWLLEIDWNNTPTFYTHRGFHAIGSGSVAAQVANGLLAHYELQARSVAHLRLIAFRTVDTVIKVLASGVGGPIQLWQSEMGSAFVEASVEDMAEIEHGVMQWTTVERESLAAIGIAPVEGLSAGGNGQVDDEQHGPPEALSEEDGDGHEPESEPAD